MMHLIKYRPELSELTEKYQEKNKELAKINSEMESLKNRAIGLIGELESVRDEERALIDKIEQETGMPFLADDLIKMMNSEWQQA